MKIDQDIGKRYKWEELYGHLVAFLANEHNPRTVKEKWKTLIIREGRIEFLLMIRPDLVERFVVRGLDSLPSSPADGEYGYAKLKGNNTHEEIKEAINNENDS